MVQTDSGQIELGERIRAVAESLRSCFAAVIASAGADRVRPTTFARRFNLDKTLSSRLLRALRTDEPSELLHLLPAPGGLRIVLDAARRHGAESGATAEANEAIDDFQSLIDEFPGGRTALDSVLASSIPEIRERSEHAAKQAVHKAMTSLLGYRCDTQVSTVVLHPSDDGDHVDSLVIAATYGLRRFRPGIPINLHGLRPDPSGSAGAEGPQTLSIDGSSDLHDFILKDFCSDPLPALSVVRDGSYISLVVREDGPPINTPIDIVSARVRYRGWERYRTASLSHEWHLVYHRYPCRTLIKDALLHEDAYPDVTPEIVCRLPSVTDQTRRRTGLIAAVDQLPLSLPVESFGADHARLRARGAPRYEEIINHTFSRVGWDRSRFRLYRCRIVYPIPLASITWWFPLPERI